jgi:hypothetical protein
MSEPASVAGTRLLDRHFRWRGTSVSRLEGFSDAVFAIVLALLFLRAAPPETFGELAAAMKGLVPFAASFAIIGYVWIEHWLFTRRYELQDGWTTFLNLLLLFLLLFYAYPLKFLFTLVCVSVFGPIGSMTHEHMLQGFETKADLIRLFVFYGVGYSAIFVVIGLMYARALHFTKLLQLNRIERFLTRSGIVQSLLQAGFGVLSIIVAWSEIGLGSGAPGWIYALIGPAMAAHGYWQGVRLERLLAEDG